MVTVVRGYHATDVRTADRLLRGEGVWEKSNNLYDWLGDGIYFWQDDPQRAWEYALEDRRGWPAANAAVISADIELGSCLDLVGRRFMHMLRQAHQHLEMTMTARGRTMPENFPGRHYLDSLVVNQVAEFWFPADTVRGVFVEGEPVYPGATFLSQQHIQISVRNPDCISVLGLAPTGGNA